MFCKNCGAPLNDGDKFCQHCGVRVENEKETVQGQNVSGNGNEVNRKDEVDNDIFFSQDNEVKNQTSQSQNNQQYNQSYNQQNANQSYAQVNSNSNQNETLPTNGMAIAGFVCSFCIPLVGLILSIIAKNQLKANPRQGGSGLATAGLIVSIISLVINVICVVFALLATADMMTNPQNYGFIKLFCGL